MTVPLVSIGCAVYNGAETLRRALDGVVAQDYPNIEIIICDDGSTDGSREICREYARLHPNIRYVENETNIGVVNNFNKLFHLSHGKYFLWADQDDVRAPSFVSKCVDVLESDDEAVLCHCHTGVFWKDFSNLMHVNTIDHVDNEPDVVKRYWRFLRTYSDTTLYGLVRSDALRATALWRTDLGSSNALLFELLLLGKFRQVPETLYFYSAKGLVARPSPGEEAARSKVDRAASKLWRPFLVLAWNQTKGVLASSWGRSRKCVLLAMLWANVAAVNGAKATFRLLERLIGRRVPRWLEALCVSALGDMRDVHFIVPPSERPDYVRVGADLLRSRHAQ